MTPDNTASAVAPAIEVNRLSLAWALKRALLGVAILFVMFGGGAWLLYSTIEPDRADASETPAAVVVNAPQPSR